MVGNLQWIVIWQIMDMADLHEIKSADDLRHYYILSDVPQVMLVPCEQGFSPKTVGNKFPADLRFQP